MFDIERHRREYHHELITVIPNVFPADLCQKLTERLLGLIERGAIPLVDHEGKGTELELDEGGKYLHHLVDGGGIREHFLELQGAYFAQTQLIAAITSDDVVCSPYPDSDINIKAYPPNGGTVGRHRDTNGITVLMYLTTNTEGPLRLEIDHDDPWAGTAMSLQNSTEHREVFAEAGSMVLMQGRKVVHDSEPMKNEFKAVVIYNYYSRGDTRRPGHFDDFVYRGRNEVATRMRRPLRSPADF
jgi:hypothetical protein